MGLNLEKTVLHFATFDKNYTRRFKGIDSFKTSCMIF
ncbi:hypothetical protein EH319_13370 [Enterococcus faecium]|nr:hypothetical protein [Enterococcus faecium]